MAEIPNALTKLLWGKTLDEIYEILRREKCLSPAGTERRAQVVAIAAEAEAQWRRDNELHMVGGTREYCIVMTLARDRYLNDRAEKLLGTIVYRRQPNAWWRFWWRE